MRLVLDDSPFLVRVTAIARPNLDRRVRSGTSVLEVEAEICAPFSPSSLVYSLLPLSANVSGFEWSQCQTAGRVYGDGQLDEGQGIKVGM